MGYWIKRTGEIYPNPDHYTFVSAHPKLFGYTAKDAKGFDLDKRQSILDAVIAKGWIRVRGDFRQGYTFEVHEFDQNAIHNIKAFLVEKRIDPKEKVLVDEQKHGASWFEPVEWFLSDEALKVARNPKRRAVTRR